MAGQLPHLTYQGGTSRQGAGLTLATGAPSRIGTGALTEPRRPEVENGYMRAMFAIHALKQMSGTGTARPIWFYNRNPGDENDWTSADTCTAVP